jgi:hypothetical protein
MVGKPHVKPGHNWQDNIAKHVEEICCESTDCIEVSNDKVQHRAVAW